VRKMALFVHPRFIQKWILSPRQARDKHRKNSRKKCRVLAASRCRSRSHHPAGSL
jgi:hypothetical protein